MNTIETETGSRRSFFAWMIGLSTTLIGLGLAIPFAGYVISPALKRRESSWNEAGHIEDLRSGVPEEMEFVDTVKDGWRNLAIAGKSFLQTC